MSYGKCKLEYKASSPEMVMNLGVEPVPKITIMWYEYKNYMMPKALIFLCCELYTHIWSLLLEITTRFGSIYDPYTQEKYQE